jgi:hypothetical protein
MILDAVKSWVLPIILAGTSTTLQAKLDFHASGIPLNNSAPFHHSACLFNGTESQAQLEVRSGWG